MDRVAQNQKEWSSMHGMLPCPLSRSCAHCSQRPLLLASASLDNTLLCEEIKCGYLYFKNYSLSHTWCDNLGFFFSSELWYERILVQGGTLEAMWGWYHLMRPVEFKVKVVIQGDLWDLDKQSSLIILISCFNLDYLSEECVLRVHLDEYSWLINLCNNFPNQSAALSNVRVSRSV